MVSTSSTQRLSDHLGSTSLTADADGNKVLEIRYREASRAALWRVDKACPLRYTAGVLREGEVRATWTNVPVNIDPAYKMPLYQYTGQASYMDDPLTSGVTEGFGLMFYNARWYDPYLNRFVQADSIIPSPSSSQSWDRYAYAQNNPIHFIDPSGHFECETEANGRCMDSKELRLWNYTADTMNELAGIDDLEALARIVDKAALIYGSYEKMIPMLSKIFLGVKESNPLTILHAAQADPCAAAGRSANDCTGNATTGSFGDTGFHRDFRDGFSQPFHFWAYVATAANTEGASGPASYLPGMITGNGANVVHEMIWPDGAGATWQDFGLAQAGMNLGTMINMGVISPRDLGNEIRNFVGVNGPGNPLVDPLKGTIPLQGNQ